MKIKTLFNIVLFSVSAVAYSQSTITGTFPTLSNQQVKLVGFKGFNTYTIDSVMVNAKGIFTLVFGKNDYGMGYLSGEDGKAFIVILASDEDLKLEGEFLSSPETVVIISGKQNQFFEKYAAEHPRRERALSAWMYLEKIYSSDSLFIMRHTTYQAIQQEKQRIKDEDTGFLGKLPKDSYVSWYLPNRKLVSSVSVVAQYRTEEIQATINAFRKIDYTDERLYKSGLLKDAVESHFWLLENMGQPLNTVFKEMSISIDYLIPNLSKDEQKFNEITRYLFNLLERQSLFQASEYLAIKILTQNSCTVNDDFAKQLESYRAMKEGNTAPDIVFSGDVLVSGSVIKTPGRLSDIISAYKVVIFGASWCPKCDEELSQLLPLYEKWKLKGVEVVFISLDTDKTLFKSFSSIFPFVSMCDYKKWNTEVVNNYYVFATPTLFMMDKDLKIILRPNSVKQIDAWVDSYLK
jgi:thiol-disulfide isomerase/thioredoxin